MLDVGWRSDMFGVYFPSGFPAPTSAVLPPRKQNRIDSSPEVARVIFSKSQIMLCPCSKPADHIHSVDQAPACPHRCPSLLNPPWHLQPGPALGLEKHWLSLDPCKHCSSPPSFGLCSTICSSGSPSQTGSEWSAPPSFTTEHSTTSTTLYNSIFD